MALSKIDPVTSIDLADKEYFHVELTSLQGGLVDASTNIVDFGGSGTVKYDTKSNFDSANDAYLLDSSDGVYLVSFSVAIRSDTISTEDIIEAIAAVFVATDGSTYTAINGGGARIIDGANDLSGSLMLTGSFIYKSTTATTKLQIRGYANTATGTGNPYKFNHDTSNMVNATLPDFEPSRCTFLSVVRIA